MLGLGSVMRLDPCRQELDAIDRAVPLRRLHKDRSHNTERGVALVAAFVAVLSMGCYSPPKVWKEPSISTADLRRGTSGQPTVFFTVQTPLRADLLRHRADVRRSLESAHVALAERPRAADLLLNVELGRAQGVEDVRQCGPSRNMRYTLLLEGLRVAEIRAKGALRCEYNMLDEMSQELSAILQGRSEAPRGSR